MTDKHLRTGEFETTVGHKGSVSIPVSVLESLGAAEGTRLRVRVTGKTTSTMLAQNGVTNEEIDRIAAIQLESADQVMKFLLSEGALKSVRRFRNVLSDRGSRR